MALNPRQRTILQLVVECYVREGKPVGSRTISRMNHVNLSPATIRNEMMDLEEREYLRRPHTSAGRVPTVEGLRYYLNHCVAMAPIDDPHRALFSGVFATQDHTMLSLLAETSGLLSEVTGFMAIAAGPEILEIPCRSIDFILLNSSKVLVLIVSRLGTLYQKIVTTPESYCQETLSRMAAFLNGIFRNQTLKSIRAKVAELLEDYEARQNQLLLRALQLSHQALMDSDTTLEVHIEGSSRLMESCDATSAEHLRQAIALIEMKHPLLDIVNQRPNHLGALITFGPETPFEPFQNNTNLLFR